ncbi:MAG TPA: carbon-nitrogen hydrolase family protein, partial [Bryobacteraceae bacterium]|nr:carbon-nitrogen hydrolase family protein [Bryobacteraceae bacterium]
YGKWITTVTGISAGQHYSFEILRKANGIAKEEVSIGVILSWCEDDAGAVPIQRDYVDRIAEAGEWRREFRVLQAPQGARSTTVELVLRWTDGSVLWKNPRLALVAAPRRRVVRVATTHLVPGPPNTLESNMSAIRGIIERAAAEKPDVILLSENVVDRLLDMPLTKRAQRVPGPLTAMLSELAQRYRAYIVTTLEEVDAGLVYNTGVLIDREGRIAGKYRKVHLPTSEAEDGVTPGNDYPVFDTDFGRIGILTCWDNWFIEPARILRLKGAEILLFPIMGDEPAHWDLVSRARAVDNGVFIVSSNTVGNTASRIIDPSGEVLAEASGPAGLAVKDLDLDKQWRTMWLSVGPSYGEGKSLYIRERRPDTYGVFTEDAHSRSR